MNSVGPTIKFAANLYRQRASAAHAGYVAGDELALLTLRAGRADPYKEAYAKPRSLPLIE